MNGDRRVYVYSENRKTVFLICYKSRAIRFCDLDCKDPDTLDFIEVSRKYGYELVLDRKPIVGGLEYCPVLLGDLEFISDIIGI